MNCASRRKWGQIMELKEFRALRIVHGALLAAVGIYGFISWMIGQNVDVPFATRLENQLVRILYIFAAVLFVAAIALGGWMRERGTPLRITYILRWVIFETVALQGVVAAALLTDWRLMVPPAALAIIGFAISFPQQETL